jgi:hypothetical protein
MTEFRDLGAWVTHDNVPLCDVMEHFVTSWDILGCHGTLWDFLRRAGTLWDILRVK